jgi:excinuclease UvrABC nuclease subunit
VAEPIIEYGVLDKDDLVERLTKEMQTAAVNLEFERAAIIRDEIKRIKSKK